MGKITTKKRILFSFRGQVTINGQIMSEKPGIFCAQNGQKLWVFGQPEGGDQHRMDVMLPGSIDIHLPLDHCKPPLVHKALGAPAVFGVV